MPAENDLIDLMRQALNNIRRHYDAAARDMGLTWSRARVILAVARSEGATQAAIAANLEIEAPTLKRLVDALEADGYLERRAVAEDARKKTLHLTARARESRVAEMRRQLRVDLGDGITPDDLRVTGDVLRRISANIARLEGK